MTGPAKIGHLCYQNLATFQNFNSHNFLFQYGTATKISKFVDNLFGFTALLTESKYYISALRYISSNDIVYFSPHALFSQARSQFVFYLQHVHLCMHISLQYNAVIYKTMHTCINALLLFSSSQQPPQTRSRICKRLIPELLQMQELNDLLQSIPLCHPQTISTGINHELYMQYFMIWISYTRIIQEN